MKDVIREIIFHQICHLFPKQLSSRTATLDGGYVLAEAIYDGPASKAPDFVMVTEIAATVEMSRIAMEVINMKQGQ